MLTLEEPITCLKHASSCSFRNIANSNFELKERNMKNLKRLCVSVALTLVLGLSVLAGEVQSPPCAPPDPGITETPPCAAAQEMPDDSANPGETHGSPSNAVA